MVTFIRSVLIAKYSLGFRARPAHIWVSGWVGVRKMVIQTSVRTRSIYLPLRAIEDSQARGYYHIRVRGACTIMHFMKHPVWVAMF